MNDTTPRVLLVEDDFSQGRLVRAFLNQDPAMRIDLFQADRLSLALEHLATQDPDVVLLDLDLPDSKGVDTVDRVRYAAPRVPIIVLSEAETEATRRQAVAHGADDFLFKSRLDRFKLERAVTLAARRKRAEAAAEPRPQAVFDVAFRQSEERFAKAFHSSPVGMIISTLAEGRLLEVNDAFLKMFGYAREEVINRTSLELDVWETPAERERIVEQLRQSGQLKGVESRYRRKGGEVRDALASVERVELQCQACVLAIFYDITEKKKLEEQLRQAQKMEAIGRLAGGVAHDFNNLLTVISGHSEMLSMNLPREHPLREPVSEINKAADRAAALTRQLLAFSRQQILEARVLDLGSVITSLEKMLRRLIGEQIQVETILAPDRHAVKVDPSQMDQVLLNLAINARDAMPQGGRLTIELRNTAWPGPEGQASPHVLLSVTDSGTGMTPEVQARIFEPFFTTKGPGSGTGLGLAVVQGIVKQSSGHISVISEVGVGSTFNIYLPAVRDAAAPRAESNDNPPLTPARGGETILLVEDEPDVLNLTALALERFGYSVLTAASGRDALDLLALHADGIALLLTDVVMPDMSGRELAETLRARLPALRVLFMSGYTDNAVLRLSFHSASVAFLQKPFTPQALARKVREVLDQKTPAQPATASCA